jgi:hypothetical protein
MAVEIRNYDDDKHLSEDEDDAKSMFCAVLFSEDEGEDRCKVLLQVETQNRANLGREVFICCTCQYLSKDEVFHLSFPAFHIYRSLLHCSAKHIIKLETFQDTMESTVS